MSQKQDRIDSKLVRKIRKSDASAFEGLFLTYCQTLIYFSWRYVRDVQVAENIVQDVFLKVWHKRKKLNPSLKIKSYLYTAVKNQTLQYLRHAKVEKQKTQPQELDSSTDSPEVKLAEKEISIAVHNAINELPDKCRHVFILSKYDHLTYSEIAEIRNISVKTVETQMGRALKYLRKRLSHLLSALLL